jgi:hypothetical protein
MKKTYVPNLHNLHLFAFQGIMASMEADLLESERAELGHPAPPEICIYNYI